MIASLASDVHGYPSWSVFLLLLAAVAFGFAVLVHRDAALPRWRLCISIGLMLFAIGVAVS